MSGMTFFSATQEIGGMSDVNLHRRRGCCSSYPKFFFSSPSLNKGGVPEEGTVKECISTTDVKNSPSVSRCYPSTMHLHRNKRQNKFSLPEEKKRHINSSCDTSHTVTRCSSVFVLKYPRDGPLSVFRFNAAEYRRIPVEATAAEPIWRPPHAAVACDRTPGWSWNKELTEQAGQRESWPPMSLTLVMAALLVHFHSG